MAEQQTETVAAQPAETAASEQVETTSEDAQAQELLADAVEADTAERQGKRELPEDHPAAKALKKANKEAAELRAKIKEFEDRDKSELDKATEKAAELEKQAQEANARIVRSEIRAAAVGKLADPKDALTFLNVDDFDIGENGEVDEAEVASAIDDLLKNKPYLAAETAKRFQGTADGGAVRDAGRPKQLTDDDLKGMTPHEIVKAKAEGQLNKLLGIE